MAKAERAVVFMDLDGTLVGPGGRIAPLVLDGIRQLRQNGHLAVVCTGRPLCRVNGELWEAGLDGAITLAGCYAQMGETVLYDAVYPQEMTLRLLRVCQEAGIPCLLENNEMNIPFAPGGIPHGYLGDAPAVASAEELFRQHPGYRLGKLVMATRHRDKILPHQPGLEGELTFQDTNMGYYEISLRGYTKAVGVRRVLDHLGRDLRGTYGIGDSANDMEMLDAVETGIAMGNAQEQVKTLADYVTRSMDDDGVYWALRHFGLI